MHIPSLFFRQLPLPLPPLPIHRMCDVESPFDSVKSFVNYPNYLINYYPANYPISPSSISPNWSNDVSPTATPSWLGPSQSYRYDKTSRSPSALSNLPSLLNVFLPYCCMPTPSLLPTFRSFASTWPSYWSLLSRELNPLTPLNNSHRYPLGNVHLNQIGLLLGCDAYIPQFTHKSRLNYFRVMPFYRLP